MHKNTGKVKVGQKVKVLEIGTPWDEDDYSHFIGQAGTIMAVLEEGCIFPYMVKFPEDDVHYEFDESELVLANKKEVE